MMPGVLSAEGDIDPDQAREIHRSWRSRHAGPNRANLPPFIGRAKFTPIAVSPQDSQLLETRQYIDTQICALYGVDPTLVGLPSPGSSLTYQTLSTREDALRVEIQNIVKKLQYVFTGLNNGKPVKLTAQDWSSDEAKSKRFESLARVGQMTGVQVMTVNEMRKELGLPPHPGGVGDELVPSGGSSSATDVGTIGDKLDELIGATSE